VNRIHAEVGPQIYSIMAKKKIGRSVSKARKKPTAKARKRDVGEQFDKALAEHLAALRELRERERALFRATVESLRTATPLERAEGLLRFWADKLEHWGDHEAVAYLISRGCNPSQYSRQIIANWREAEKERIDRAVGTDQSAWAQSVRQNPTKALSGFWSASDSQGLSMDATMLRTNEWCGLAGFEPWWKEIAKQVQEAAFSGGLHLFYLFNLYRSELAIHLMNGELSLALKSVEALSSVKHPWLWSDPNFGSAIEDAASFVFANARAGGVRSELYEPALHELRRHFDARSGGWPDFSNKAGMLSIQATAMALHALNVANVPDWEHYASPAAQWLWDQQHHDGYWFERGSPDPVWLTVLVLDAIELARGGAQLTFRKTAPIDAPLVFVAYQHADAKWLDELKKHLGALIHSERIEFFNDREIGAGEEWDPAIRKKLSSAKVIVPMISPNFLSSKYIQTVELPTTIRRHVLGEVKVLPVLLESCDWEALESNGFSLSRINFLPRDGRNDLKPLARWGARKNDAFTQIARTIRNLTRPAG
jgi:hypothetical protein